MNDLVPLLGQPLEAAREALVARFGEPVAEDLGCLYLIWKAHGVCARIEDGVVSTVFLYREGHEGYRQFQGALPGGVVFTDGADEVASKLGPPTVRGEFADASTAWVRYDSADCLRHFQLDEGGQGVLMVTLMRSEAEAEPAGGLKAVFMPSLVSLLLNRERAKGTPLTEAEVLQLRDGATVVMSPPDVAAELDTSRGYEDLDPERVWEEWQEARKHFEED